MRAKIVSEFPAPPPPQVVQIEMSLDEARALFAVTNWSGITAKVVGEQPTVDVSVREIKETLRDLFYALSKVGVR